LSSNNIVGLVCKRARNAESEKGKTFYADTFDVLSSKKIEMLNARKARKVLIAHEIDEMNEIDKMNAENGQREPLPDNQ